MDLYDCRILSILHFIFTDWNHFHSRNGERWKGERLSLISSARHDMFRVSLFCLASRIFLLITLFFYIRYFQDWTLVAGNVYPIAFVVGEMALAGIFYLVRDWRLALIIITLFNLSMTMLPL